MHRQQAKKHKNGLYAISVLVVVEFRLIGCLQMLILSL